MGDNALGDDVEAAVAAWLRSDDAMHRARTYRHRLVNEYRKLLGQGVDDNRLSHARGNAQGRFYEYLVNSALSRALLPAPGVEAEFVCAGGAVRVLRPFSRSKHRDIIIEAASFPGGRAIVRAEYDALIWTPTTGVVLGETTSSAKNLTELTGDIWRKQAITRRVYRLDAPPPVILMTPHPMSSLRARIPGLAVVNVPMPEPLWQALVVDPDHAAGRPHPPAERFGRALRAARSPRIPEVMATMADAAAEAVRAGRDLEAFYRDHRPSLRMIARIHLGHLRGRAALDVLRGALPADVALAPDPIALVTKGSARLHLTLRCQHGRGRLDPYLHVLSRRDRREYRIEPGRRARWVHRHVKRQALRREIPKGDGARLDAAFARDTIAACRAAWG